MKNIFVKNKFDFSFVYFFIFILSSILTFIIGELYFYVPNGVDYVKYVKYLEFFGNKSDTTHTGQGLIYYFIVSFVSFTRKSGVSNLNIQNMMNSNIHFANFLIYIIGIYGFYLLLRRYKFSKSSILISFTVLNFSIPIFIMRSILKPEVLAFSLIPWIILGFERYFETANHRNFMIALFPLVICLNIKGSVTAMVGLILLIKYFKNIKQDFRKYLVHFLIFIFAFSIMFIENQNINSYNVLEHNLSNETNYDNKASIDFFTKINKWDFYYFPIFPYHNNSAIGITLLDTYGDYFNVFINYDEHLFFYEKDASIFVDLDDSDGFKYGKYTVQYFSIIFSFFLYGFGMYYAFKEKTKFIFYISPIVGLFVVSLSAFGIPFNHFDPKVGDTLKTNYYSFLIGMSLIFIISSFFKKIKFTKILILLILPFLFFSTLGFPKTNQEKINFYLQDKIQISPFCTVISLFDNNLKVSDCFDETKKLCEYNIASNDAQIIVEEDLIKINIDSNNPIIFVDDNSEKLMINNQDECKKIVNQGGKVYSPLFDRLRLLPLFNMLYLICSIISIIFIAINERKKNYGK